MRRELLWRRGAPPRRDGFTLVDIMVALPSAAILVLVASLLLGGMIRQYQRVQISLELQRDMQVAMTAIRHAVRHASPGAASVVSGRLHIQSGGGTTSFARTATNDLLFDPNRSSNGDEVTLTDGKVSAFSVAITSSGVNVNMTLEDDDVSTAVQSTIAFRN